MGIVNTVVLNVFKFIDKVGEVDAWMPDREAREETEEQQLQRRVEIQQVLEDISRQERIMARRI